MKKSLLALALCAGMTHGGGVFHDFGSDADVNPTSSMWINTGDPDWSALWFHNDPDMTQNNFAFSECEDHFHWVSEGHEGEVTSRGMKFRKKTIVYATTEGIDVGQDIYVTLRFKDNLVKPLTVVSGSGSFEIGGQADRKWKTKQVKLSGSRLRANSSQLSFRFGENYTNDMAGLLHLDMMKVSNDDDMSEFPQDAQGHWPVPMGPNLHANIRDTNVYHPGDEPFFPFGVYTGFAFALPRGDDPSFSSNPASSFQHFADSHINTLVFHAWGNDWGSSWKQWDNEWPWLPDNLVYTELGFDEYMDQAKHHDLKVIPNPVLDTRAYFINERSDKEWGVEALFEDLMARYGGDPSILAWNPVDEWDHEDVGYTKPHVQDQRWYQMFKDGDPTTPVYMSLMGFMGPLAWVVASPSTDIFANDKYYDEGDDHVAGAKKQHSYMMQMIPHNKGRIAIPRMADGADNMGEYPPNGEKRFPNQQEIVYQAYYNITAGAQGLLYFTNRHPMDPNSMRYGVESTWAGMQQVGEELFGEKGIAHALIAPSVTLDIMGVEGIVSVSNRDIYTILKKDENDVIYLITVNMDDAPVTGTITVSGLPNATHEVRFEGRNTVSDGGEIDDTWGKYERHVYVLSVDGTEPPPIEPPPVDPCDLLPWLPDCNEPPPIEPPDPGPCSINRAR